MEPPYSYPAEVRVHTRGKLNPRLFRLWEDDWVVYSWMGYREDWASSTDYKVDLLFLVLGRKCIIHTFFWYYAVGGHGSFGV